VHLGLVRGQLGQQPPQPQRLQAQPGPDQVVAGGRRVPLVEDQVDDLQHRRQALGQLRRAGQLERHVSPRQRLLGRGDPLGDGRLVDEERAGDLGRRQAADEPQCQRHPGLRRQQRMAGDEHQPQHVVRLGLPLLVQFPGELLLLALAQLGPADVVDGPALGDRHEPRAGVVRHARRRPLLQRGHERVLGQLLGEADVVHHPSQPGDDPRRLQPPDGVDGAPGVHHSHDDSTAPAR
jgi:hypothetical protein